MWGNDLSMLTRQMKVPEILPLLGSQYGREKQRYRLGRQSPGARMGNRPIDLTEGKGQQARTQECQADRRQGKKSV